MNRPVKVFIATIAVCVLLLIAAAVLIPFFIDPNDYKDEIASAVREHTGREIVFTGDIDLKVFPWLGVTLGPVALSNAPGFGDEPFARINKTAVFVKLLPLLSSEVRIKSLDIDGLALNLARNANGKSNWDDLVKTGEAQATVPGADSTGSGGGLAAFELGGINISNSSLAWDDGVSNQNIQLAGLTLETGTIAMGAPFDFSFAMDVDASDPHVVGTLQLAARADIDPALKKHSLTGISLNVDAQGEGLPGGVIDAKLTGDIILDLDTDTLQVNGIELSAMGLDLAGKALVTNLTAKPTVDTALRIEEFDPQALLRSLGLDPIQTTDPEALRKASVSLEATASDSFVQLDKLTLILDETILQGTAKVMNFTKPAIRFDLAANTLDVDRYLPPAGQDKEASAGGGMGSGGGKQKQDSGGLPKEQLRALNVDGTLKVGSLKAYNVRLTDTQVTIKAKDGVIRIAPLATALYGGSYTSTLLADVSGNTTKTKIQADLTGMALGGLLADLTGTDRVTGTTALSLNVSGVGDDWAALSKTLNGTAKASVLDGVFSQVINKDIQKQAVATKPGLSKEELTKKRPFNMISASASITNGVLSSDDLNLRAKGVDAAGKGGVDLGRGYVDYTAIVDLDTLPAMPIRISGPYSDLSYSLDTVAFLKGTALSIIDTGGAVGKGALNMGGDALQGIGKGIGKGLGGLFGGKKKLE